jgi:hypothetical protein
MRPHVDVAPSDSRLNAAMTTTRRREVPFVPAYADHFCVNCGFPFREVDWGRRYCHEYDKSPDHGRCGRRLRDAGQQDGLEMRLRKTQEADPYVWATGEDAVAHGWVRQNYPRMNLQNWQPARES